MTLPKPTFSVPTFSCDRLVSTMIGHFTTRLEVEARKAGGALGAEAIRDRKSVV